MGKSQAEEEKAVKCGYWHLWRYNPALEAEGKNPFTLDSKEPDWSGFQDFLKGEVRYASVMKQYPQEAEELFKAPKKTLNGATTATSVFPKKTGALKLQSNSLITK